MQQITATELRERLNDAPRPLLLDVREPHEFGYCRIEGSINIPMNLIFLGKHELDPARETVVICHRGARSAQVAHFLFRNGFEKILNLQGGVAAWASEVDASMPRY